MRRLLAAIALASPACSPSALELYLPAENGETSAIIAVERNGTLEVQAVELDAGRGRLRLDDTFGGDPTRVTALLYTQSLAELDLIPGPVPRTTDDPRRGLPDQPRTMAGTLTGDGIAWEGVAAPPGPLYEFRTPWNALLCVHDGGCFAEDRAGQVRCHTPCPAVTPVAPAPVVDPAPPQLTCPSGWRQVQLDEHTACDPWPEGGPASCAAGEAHFPGEPRCRRVGTPCPTGQWADDLPAGRTIIRVGAGESIAAALATAGPGTIVALARARWEEALTLPPEVTLWGACPEQTVLAIGGVVVAERDAVIRNLRIETASTSAVLVTGAGASATIEQVIVERSGAEQVVATGGATLTVRDSVIRDGESVGLTVFFDTTLIAERVVLSRNTITGLGATGATARLGDVAVLGTRSRPMTNDYGRGLNFEQGADVTIDRLVASGNSEVGLVASWPETRVTAGDLIIEDTAPLGGYGGDGIAVYSGATVTGTRVLLRRNAWTGVSVSGTDARASLADVIITDTLHPHLVPRAGVGAQVTYDGTLELDRAVIARSGANGAYAAGLATMRMRLTDSTISDSRAYADAVGGGGIQVIGGHVTLERVRLLRNHESAVIASGASSEIVASDLQVIDTRPDGASLNFGNGLVLLAGARTRLERALFAGNVHEAMNVRSPGTHLEAYDVVARGTTSQVSDGRFGHAIVLWEGATATFERAVFEDNAAAGIYATGAGARGFLTDVRITGTDPPGCVMTVCGLAEAAAVLVSDFAHVDVDRFWFEGNHDAGLIADTDATATLSNGRITGHRIGARTDTEGVTVRDLATGVDYGGNDDLLQVVPYPALSE